MWRPRSDVGRIQWIDVQFTHTDGIPDNVWLHIRQPKETNTKNIQLGVIQEDLSVDHTLFLGYLEVDTKPTTSVQPSTVGKCVQTAMKKAGVDRRYKAHSLRSATSTKAVMLGASIDQIKDHANWSRNSNTFEVLLQASKKMPQNTTLEDETEPTRIELGTTSNTKVGEEESENVVCTRPWYRRLF
ncbi:hypothetical protein G6F68_012085 [Rhizopus microsporus]|nr:hypothetical protein G6F68_012085 [Rhizopus microsporus]